MTGRHRPTSRTGRRRFVLAATAALTVVMVGVAWAVAPSATQDDAATLRQICEAAQRGQLSSADRTWAQRCARVAGVGASVLASPTPGPSASPTATTSPSPSPTASPSPTPSASPTTGPSPTPTSSPTPVPTTPPPSPSASPTPSPSPTPPPPSGWPGPDNTGVPNGTPLTAYTGPCTITVANTVIDAKTINCNLDIRAHGVVVTRSRITGTVSTYPGSVPRFRLEDSEVDAPVSVTSLGNSDFLVLRSEIQGGNRAIYCQRDCEVRDSWLHGTQIQGADHASAVRMEQGSIIIHNTLACDWLIPTAQDGGCSADLTGYPDFAPVKNNLIQANLFVANPTGAAFCAYGGASAGKPYSNDPTNATNIVFRDNVFQRGSNRNCAAYGPITDFAVGRSGNVWSGNVWDDGGTVNP